MRLLDAVILMFFSSDVRSADEKKGIREFARLPYFVESHLEKLVVIVV